MSVLEVKRVGSFTAFVLAATDAGALSGWLKKNDLVSTPETDAWLAHYVRLGFFYVAMRYEPPLAPSGETTSEVMRISFDTPLPYYPYREPTRAGALVDQVRSLVGIESPRILELWLVSDRPRVPVAARAQGAEIRWVQPLLAGHEYTEGIDGLLGALLDTALVPSRTTLHLQRFADQKRSRAGFGDILFVPRTAVPADPATDAKLAPLAPVIDPSLEAPP